MKNMRNSYHIHSKQGNMETFKTGIFYASMLFVSLLFFQSCKKDKNCYDENLYNQFKNTACIFDCIGVKGCDGKTYCNECVANSAGIRIIP